MLCVHSILLPSAVRSFTVQPSVQWRRVRCCAAAGAQTEEIAAPGPLNETKAAEVRVVSTEFGYAPAKVIVVAGRAVTLVLDNSGAETEHDLFVPAFGFRLQAKAGETARKSTVFDKPGKYEFRCDLPGHRDAGMKGTLIVGAF
jgi:uncharacterized cupredoxin-like copper-binding protein